jgi:hypothetical protein
MTPEDFKNLLERLAEEYGNRRRDGRPNAAITSDDLDGVPIESIREEDANKGKGTLQGDQPTPKTMDVPALTLSLSIFESGLSPLVDAQDWLTQNAKAVETVYLEFYGHTTSLALIKDIQVYKVSGNFTLPQSSSFLSSIPTT